MEQSEEERAMQRRRVNRTKKYLLGADPELLNFFPLFCRVAKEDFIKRGSARKVA